MGRRLVLILLVLAVYPAYHAIQYIRVDHNLKHYLKNTSYPSWKERMFGAPDLPPPTSDDRPTFPAMLDLTITDSMWKVMEAESAARKLTPNTITASNKTWLNTTASIGDSIYPIKIRLRGDTDDNYRFGLDHVSLRINVRQGKRIAGRKKLSIIRPFHETGSFGVFYYNLMAEEGFISPDCELIRVSFNGEDQGGWLLEEGFREELVEQSGRSNQGLLLHFEDDCTELENIRNTSGFPRLIPYQFNKVKKDSSRLQHYYVATKKIEEVLQKRFTRRSNI